LLEVFAPAEISRQLENRIVAVSRYEESVERLLEVEAVGLKVFSVY